ncbi:MAG TPA: hypothetical protein DDY13_11285 [Cytophagales bacterium]|jgi:outer membrane protein|nr:hypothetical protein [Cytophagales bacterium]
MATKFYKMKNILPVINTILLLALIGFGYWLHLRDRKIVYFNNQALFEAFYGTKYYEQKLMEEENAMKMELDSLQRVISDMENDTEIASAIEKFRNRKQKLEAGYQKLSGNYTDQLWNQINGYVSEFGEENEYTYILGATGNGTLMYAGENLNITKELIEYINNKYEDEQ